MSGQKIAATSNSEVMIRCITHNGSTTGSPRPLVEIFGWGKKKMIKGRAQEYQ